MFWVVVVTTVLYVYASSAHCSTCTGIGIGGIKRSRSYSLVIVVVLFYFVFCVASKKKSCTYRSNSSHNSSEWVSPSRVQKESLSSTGIEPVTDGYQLFSPLQSTALPTELRRVFLLAHCSIFEYNKIRLNWQYCQLDVDMCIDTYRCLTKL